MNQASVMPMGADITTLAASYAFPANARVGSINLIMINVGTNTATLDIKEALQPSGWGNITPRFTINAGGTVSKYINIVGQKIAFFGSGDTTVNCEIALPHQSNLSGEQIDVEPQGKKGWVHSDSYQTLAYEPNWSSQNPTSH